jgi:mono/diheme cytochrome c family protein
VKRLLMMTVACVVLTGCKTVPPPKPIEQLTPQEHVGYVLFQQNCAQCHYDRDTGSLHGPSLLSVYKKQYLQSGAPANDERITWTIQHGRGMMPPLAGQVSQDDIASILAYLKTL